MVSLKQQFEFGVQGYDLVFNLLLTDPPLCRHTEEEECCPRNSQLV
jgi:hypothetical protein